ncbi:MAG: RNA polymerase factor sigma-54 [Acidobacteria bacterium]|nr:RNA polymerase factor sigma-54 [Acidobacteriota bacterium]
MPYLEQKLQPRLSQRLIITPQLQQAIRLLQLSKIELQEEIAQELVDNPALEDAVTHTEMTAAEAPAPTSEREVTAGDDSVRDNDDFDYDSFLRDLEDSYRPTQGMVEHRSADELPSFEQILSSAHQLSDHLQWQLEMSTLTEAERTIGEAIIGNLDERGYLEASIEEIAAMGPQPTPWTPEAVDRVRRFIQHFDPVGVASRDVSECLLVQLEVGGLGSSSAATAIRAHLDLLEQHRYEELRVALGIDGDELDEVLDIIRHLDPRPGEKYQQSATSYITPDVFVIKDGDSYRIVLNEDGLPRLRVSPAYRRMIDRAAQTAVSDASAKDFAREKVRAAVRLIRSLEERQRTIAKVANSIVKFQREFLDRGIEAIRPLVLRNVAEDIGMHEATVSRVVRQKYMHTPRGLFEMRFFFHSGLNSSDGGSVSSLTVKDKIKKLVGDESASKPLSDQAIAAALQREGLQIARRTVAKYREELHIPPSTQRKRSRNSRRA